MIKFWIHKYNLIPAMELNAVSGKKPREGALLRMEWPDGKVGYSDLFPWPELGDASLEDQLHEISRDRMTRLSEQSIWLARKDAKARAQGINSLQGGQKIKNHYTIADYRTMTDEKLTNVKSSGFSTIKVKVGRHWEDELPWLTRVLRQHGFSARLDFNGTADKEIIKSIEELPLWMKQKIEFIEDLCPYNYEVWTAASKFITLAVDHEYNHVVWDKPGEKLPFKVIVIKPARQDVDTAARRAVDNELKMVVTSSMDHPLGVAQAAVIASELKAKHTSQVLDCGCLTNHLYAPNDFSSRMIIQGPYLIQIEGLGIGFDQILGELPWKPL